MTPFSMTGLVKAMIMDGLGYIVILTSKPAHLKVRLVFTRVQLRIHLTSFYIVHPNLMPKRLRKY